MILYVGMKWVGEMFWTIYWTITCLLFSTFPLSFILADVPMPQSQSGLALGLFVASFVTYPIGAALALIGLFTKWVNSLSVGSKLNTKAPMSDNGLANFFYVVMFFFSIAGVGIFFMMIL